MEKSKVIIDQIKADIHNIQELVNLLPYCKKTRYNAVQSTIKTLVREIRYQKELISTKVYHSPNKNSLPLFEIDPSEIEQIDMEDIASFFGNIGSLSE